MKNTNQKPKLFTRRLDFLFRPNDVYLIKKAAKAKGVTMSHFVRHFSVLQAQYILDQQQQESIPA
jgi:uncharacterized protein (DUF1778 family)